jgi:hypothetical protein
VPAAEPHNPDEELSSDLEPPTTSLLFYLDSIARALRHVCVRSAMRVVGCGRLCVSCNCIVFS